MIGLGMDRERVQALVESGLRYVPKEYIQPPKNRPVSLAEGEVPHNHVPVIDVAEFNEKELQRVRKQIGQACRDWGVFQIINHGLPKTLLDSVKNVGHQFFQSPIDEKLKYSCERGAAASEGYGSRMLVKEDQVFDWRDYFDHHTLPLSRRNRNKWPLHPPTYRETIEEYSKHMELLAQRLIGIMSEALGLPASYLQEVIGEPYQNITISYYPPCPQPDLTLGLQDHSDMGIITLLIQDEVGGLDVLKDSQWIRVVPCPDAIVVNLGDATQIFTNGQYKSVVHRVIVNAERSRLSVATFYDPSKETLVSPAPELVTKDSSQKYKEVLYGDYVSAWYSTGPEGKRNIDALQIR